MTCGVLLLWVRLWDWVKRVGRRRPLRSLRLGLLEVFDDVAFDLAKVADDRVARLARTARGDRLEDLLVPGVRDAATPSELDHALRVGHEQRLDRLEDTQQQRVLGGGDDAAMELGVELDEFVVGEIV